MCLFCAVFSETVVSTRQYKKTQVSIQTHQFLAADLIHFIVLILGFTSYFFAKGASLVWLCGVSLISPVINGGIFSIETGIPIEFTRGGVWIKRE